MYNKVAIYVDDGVTNHTLINEYIAKRVDTSYTLITHGMPVVCRDTLHSWAYNVMPVEDRGALLGKGVAGLVIFHTGGDVSEMIAEALQAGIKQIHIHHQET